MNNYGYFNNEGTEFIITNPKTPRDFDNYLFNNAIYSEVQQTGVGYTMYQIDGKETTLLSSMNRDVYYDRDTIMNRLVYIRDNDTGKFWNINWEPVKEENDYYRCRHGIGYTILESKVDGIEASLRIFVPDGDDPVELWTIDIKNVSGKKRNLSVFVYYEFSFNFQWGFDAYGHLIYMHSYYNKDNNILIAEKHPEKKPHNYLTGFMASDVVADAFDGSKEKFKGRYNKLNEPQCVIDGNCSNTEGTNEFISGVMQYNIELDENKDSKINVVVGVSDTFNGAVTLKDKYLGSFEDEFSKLKEVKQKMFDTKVVNTPDKHFNRLINIWIKQQILYGVKWTRWGAKCYRDIVQHTFGITDVYPELAKSVLVRVLRYQYKSGGALHVFDPFDGKEYSDGALWLINTLTNYIKETGDFAILDMKAPYLDDENEYSVISHIERALDYLEYNKGVHGLTLIKNGDWNDSLTALGKEGRGESVWLSMAYASALLQIAELFSHLKDTENEKKYLARYEDMKKAINESAWDNDRYIGCYSDSYNRIFSSDSKEGQIYLNTQSWAIIADVANEERTQKMLKTLDDNMLTGFGYLLSYPTFKTFDQELGRITAMEPGIAENGTVYSHGNAFLMYALLRIGYADKAFDIFKRVAPGYYADDNQKKKEGVPYVFTNCYYGPDHRHSAFEMEYSWITGSVAWFYNAIHQWMFGIRKEYDGLTVNPQLPSEWNEASVDMSYRGKHLNVKISRGETKKIVLNGKELDGNYIALSNLDNENELTVII